MGYLTLSGFIRRLPHETACYVTCIDLNDEFIDVAED